MEALKLLKELGSSLKNKGINKELYLDFHQFLTKLNLNVTNKKKKRSEITKNFKSQLLTFKQDEKRARECVSGIISDDIENFRTLVRTVEGNSENMKMFNLSKYSFDCASDSGFESNVVIQTTSKEKYIKLTDSQLYSFQFTPLGVPTITKLLLIRLFVWNKLKYFDC